MVVLVVALAVLALVLAWRGPLHQPAAEPGWLPALGLVVALTAGAYFHVEYRHGDDDVDGLDLFEAALAPALLLLPGAAVVVAVVVAKSIAEALLRVRPLKAAFNVAAWATAAAVGSVVLAALDERPAGGGDGFGVVSLVLAMVVVAVVNQAAFVTVLRLDGRRSFRDVLIELRPAIVPAWLVGGGVILSFGVLFAGACAAVPALAWLLPVPLTALYRASQGYAASRAEQARASVLHRAVIELAASSGDGREVTVFLERVRHAFGAAAVRLVTVVDGRVDVQVAPPLTGATGSDEEGRPGDPGLAVALASLEGSSRVTVRSGDDAIAAGLRRRGWRDGLVVEVPAGGHDRRVLCVFDPRGVVTSHDAEIVELEVLAGELGSTLARADAEVGLRTSEARLRTLVQEASDMVVLTDASGVTVDRFPASSTWPVRVAPGDDVASIAHPDDADEVRRHLGDLGGRAGATCTFAWRASSTDGSWRHLETAATNLLHDPAVRGVVLISRDVSERVQANELVARQAEALDKISRRRPIADTVASLASATRAQAPGARLTVVLCADHTVGAAVHGDPLPSSLVDGLVTVFCTGARSDDRARRSEVVPDVSAHPWWSTLSTPGSTGSGGVVGPGGVGALWAAPISAADGATTAGVAVVHFDHPRAPSAVDAQVLESIADLAHIAVEASTSEARLVHQATHDPLTGLPNRVLFLDRTSVAVSRLSRSTRSVAVLFVDLDRFKRVNDSLGHDVGDRLLVALARRLEQVMRPSDTVARFGGDEFTILCEDIEDRHEATAIATRVRDVLAAPVDLEGHDLYVTASVGIAHTSDPSRPAQALVEEADAAMYEAKGSGGNLHRVYDEAVRSRALLEVMTYQALREAIDAGELCLHYQPMVELATGRTVGVEVLVRWEHPTLGLLEPDHFVPFAEATGLIVPIGAHVLKEACAQWRRWAPHAGEGFAMAVNLSARQFADPGLIGTVTTALEEAGVEPSGLVLEITESALMEHAAVTLVTLRTLHHLGVRLVIDDFGTGYSSLTYLKRFPVDALKVDRSFVAGLGVDAVDEAIVTSVIDLAHNLGMVAVAEGVENDVQVGLLAELHCDLVQGYRFSRPVAADEISFEPVETIDLRRRASSQAVGAHRRR